MHILDLDRDRLVVVIPVRDFGEPGLAVRADVAAVGGPAHDAVEAKLVRAAVDAGSLGSLNVLDADRTGLALHFLDGWSFQDLGCLALKVLTADFLLRSCLSSPPSLHSLHDGRLDVLKAQSVCGCALLATFRVLKRLF